MGSGQCSLRGGDGCGSGRFGDDNWMLILSGLTHRQMVLQWPREISGEQALFGAALLCAHQPALLLQLGAKIVMLECVEMIFLDLRLIFYCTYLKSKYYSQKVVTFSRNMISFEMYKKDLANNSKFLRLLYVGTIPVPNSTSTEKDYSTTGV